MLTRTGEHALRAVIFLARQADDRPVSAESVAAALGAPANYLAKTLSALAAAGIVRGRRGPHGGYRLLIPADRLTVARVTSLFEPEHGITSCLLGGRACDSANPCSAHFRWLAVRAAADEPLRTTTIADLIAAPGVGDDRPLAVPADGGSPDEGLLQLLYLA